MDGNRDEDENHVGYSKLKSFLHQYVYDIAAICARHGIKQAVLCPGSRSAPILLGFTRHPEIQCYTFSDERSAAFIALGLAQSSGRAVALICTSGSAAYNFAPAVVEAYYSHVPLLVLTADRPPEWIDQLDGQTIRQENIYGSHCKKSFIYPVDFSHADAKWHAHRMINEAIIMAKTFPQGPVHINVPLREPLYDKTQEQISFSDDLHVFKANNLQTVLTDQQKKSLLNEWNQYQHKLLVLGQMQPTDDLIEVITMFSKKHQIPVVADVIANSHNIPGVIKQQDLFLGQANEERLKSLQPDLLISIGQSLISKSLKVFLRKHPAKAHWHIQDAGTVADTFQQLSRIIYASSAEVLNTLNQAEKPEAFLAQKQENYFKLWEIEQRKTERSIKDFLPQESLNELELIYEILKSAPDGSAIHLANSMAVRYGNFIGLSEDKPNVRVWSNRGTSGIDGCTSTTVGHTLNAHQLQILITGDMAFFYDRNAFWHNHKTDKLRIVLLNNHGSLIFRLLDGPSRLPEFDEYFKTHQSLNAKSLAADFGIDYLKLDNKRKMKNLLKDFFDPEGPAKILELESDAEENKRIFEALKNKIKSNYEA